jgi:hypothetical protein
LCTPESLVLYEIIAKHVLAGQTLSNEWLEQLVQIPSSEPKRKDKVYIEPPCIWLCETLLLAAEPNGLVALYVHPFSLRIGRSEKMAAVAISYSPCRGSRAKKVLRKSVNRKDWRHRELKKIASDLAMHVVTQTTATAETISSIKFGAENKLAKAQFLAEPFFRDTAITVGEYLEASSNCLSLRLDVSDIVSVSFQS